MNPYNEGDSRHAVWEKQQSMREFDEENDYNDLEEIEPDWDESVYEPYDDGLSDYVDEDDDEEDD